MKILASKLNSNRRSRAGSFVLLDGLRNLRDLKGILAERWLKRNFILEGLDDLSYLEEDVDLLAE